MFIYKIWKEDCDDFYIGSTVDFRKRKWAHKAACTNPNCHGHHYNLYQHIRANGGWGSWSMDIIEECETQDREIEIIKEMKPSLNTNHYDFDKKEIKPTQKDKWYEKNSNRLKKKYKEYREENADRIKEYQKEYRKNNKEYNKEYQKEYQKKYREKKKKYLSLDII
tara:strand:+ start:20 stop:517 length:498 start_codon:yes stop_codon:yes gene_type:complete